MARLFKVALGALEFDLFSKAVVGDAGGAAVGTGLGAGLAAATRRTAAAAAAGSGAGSAAARLLDCDALDGA